MKSSSHSDCTWKWFYSATYLRGIQDPSVVSMLEARSYCSSCNCKCQAAIQTLKWMTFKLINPIRLIWMVIFSYWIWSCAFWLDLDSWCWTSPFDCWLISKKNFISILNLSYFKAHSLIFIIWKHTGWSFNDFCGLTKARVVCNDTTFDKLFYSILWVLYAVSRNPHFLFSRVLEGSRATALLVLNTSYLASKTVCLSFT